MIVSVEVEKDGPRGYAPDRWLVVNGTRIDVPELVEEELRELAAKLNAALSPPATDGGARATRERLANEVDDILGPLGVHVDRAKMDAIYAPSERAAAQACATCGGNGGNEPGPCARPDGPCPDCGDKALNLDGLPHADGCPWIRGGECKCKRVCRHCGNRPALGEACPACGSVGRLGTW